MDISRVEKRREWRFSKTSFGFPKAHPRSLSDVTHRDFGPQGLCGNYEHISFPLGLGIHKYVKRLVQLELKHRGLFGTPGGFFVLFALPKGHSRRFGASGEGVGFGPSSHVHACVSRMDIACVENVRGRDSPLPLCPRLSTRV